MLSVKQCKLSQSALIVALANVQVPILLGEVVNVVAKFTSETTNEGRNFMQEITAPSVRLIKYYVGQVGLLESRILPPFFFKLCDTLVQYCVLFQKLFWN